MSWSNNKDEHIFLMFNKGVTYCLQEQFSWGGKLSPPLIPFLKENLGLAQGIKHSHGCQILSSKSGSDLGLVTWRAERTENKGKELTGK